MGTRRGAKVNKIVLAEGSIGVPKILEELKGNDATIHRTPDSPPIGTTREYKLTRYRGQETDTGDGQIVYGADELVGYVQLLSAQEAFELSDNLILKMPAVGSLRFSLDNASFPMGRISASGSLERETKQ